MAACMLLTACSAVCSLLRPRSLACAHCLCSQSMLFLGVSSFGVRVATYKGEARLQHVTTAALLGEAWFTCIPTILHA